jgi:hypothetical protein
MYRLTRYRRASVNSCRAARDFSMSLLAPRVPALMAGRKRLVAAHKV